MCRDVPRCAEMWAAMRRRLEVRVAPLVRLDNRSHSGGCCDGNRAPTHRDQCAWMLLNVCIHHEEQHDSQYATCASMYKRRQLER